MHILVLGNDGRAYSLGKRLVMEGHKVSFMPGNSACSFLGETFDVPPALTLKNSVRSLLVTGGGVDLVVGTALDTSENKMVDYFREYVPVYGVPKTGVRLEADRGYASEVCERVGIKTPAFKVGTVDEAIKHVQEQQKPFVVKWDSLVGGTNVTVCESMEDTIHELERRKTKQVMLQERLYGVEVSFMVSIVGENCDAVGLCTVFEHKRAYNGDMGPMTAEMGSLVLAGVSSKGMELFEKLRPELQAIGYQGLLDINCIMDTQTGELGFIEFTARFGDPTTEIVLPMIKSDVGELLRAWAIGEPIKPEFKHACGVGVVIAGGGYPFPMQVEQGVPILLDDQWYEHIDFMSAQLQSVDPIRAYTKGGRQLIALGHGSSVQEAQRKAYSNALKVRFRDMYYRTDIGDKWYRGEKQLCVTHGIVEDGLGGFNQWELR